MSPAGTFRPRRATLGFAVALGLALAACASSKSGDAVDANPGDATDAMVDPCDDVVCPGLTFCKEGVCVPYPACPADGGVGGGPDPDPMCPSGTVCRNGVCLPTGVDVDEDGFDAEVDCDEQNPEINPGEVESCNAVDDNCSGTADDADPMAMCAGADPGRVCVAGSCVCPTGTFDLDPTVPGCECTAAPGIDQGTTCATAIDVGNLADTGQMQAVTGNIPNGRTVWYRFRGVDSADASCDNYHVAARFLGNPSDQFRIRVFRGDCSGAIGAPEQQYTSADWYTDFRANVSGRLTGQCPCAGAGSVPPTDVSRARTTAADYYVAVERLTGGTDTCASFQVELSNGLYDAP
jgi:hypothetical protein